MKGPLVAIPYTFIDREHRRSYLFGRPRQDRVPLEAGVVWTKRQPRCEATRLSRSFLGRRPSACAIPFPLSQALAQLVPVIFVPDRPNRQIGRRRQKGGSHGWILGADHQMDLAESLPIAAAFRELLELKGDRYYWDADYKEVFRVAFEEL